MVYVKGEWMFVCMCVCVCLYVRTEVWNVPTGFEIILSIIFCLNFWLSFEVLGKTFEENVYKKGIVVF